MWKPDSGKCWEVLDHSSANLSADTISCGWNPSMAAVWRVLELEMLRSNYALLLHLEPSSQHRTRWVESCTTIQWSIRRILKTVRWELQCCQQIVSHQNCQSDIRLAFHLICNWPALNVPYGFDKGPKCAKTWLADWPGHFGSIPDLSQQLHVP